MNRIRLRGSELKPLVASMILILSQPLACASSRPSPQVEVDGFRPGFSQTLNDVVAKLGSAEIWHVGDASEAEDRLCYVTLLGHSQVIVTFSSSAMAGEARQINAISVAKAASSPNRKRCSTPNQRLNIESSLRLGMSKSQVSSLLVNGTDSGSTITDVTCTRRYMETTGSLFARWAGRPGCFEDSNRPYYDECRTVRVNFDHERVVLISHSVVQSVC